MELTTWTSASGKTKYNGLLLADGTRVPMSLKNAKKIILENEQQSSSGCIQGDVSSEQPSIKLLSKRIDGTIGDGDIDIERFISQEDKDAINSIRVEKLNAREREERVEKLTREREERVEKLTREREERVEKLTRERDAAMAIVLESLNQLERREISSRETELLRKTDEAGKQSRRLSPQTIDVDALKMEDS